MSNPWIIWTVPRTGGTTLSRALKAVSEHKKIEDEPFQYGDHPKELAHIYEHWRKTKEISELTIRLIDRCLIKHIPEAFDDEFNIKLAQISSDLNYKHINLKRQDELARLISRDIAQQLDVWQPPKSTEVINDIISGKRQLKPLDVPHLIDNYRLGQHRWHKIKPHLGKILDITMEDLLYRDRQATITRLIRYLNLPESAHVRINTLLDDGGQDSGKIWRFLPNIDELKQALQNEGLTI
jgi:hypothetical protein